MNLLKRAILYIVRKWKKTLLLFFILLAVATLALSGLAIADAKEVQTEELRGTTGSSFTVERDISTGGWSGGNQSYSTQEFLKDEMIKSIAKTDGISAYNAVYKDIPNLCKKDGTYLKTANGYGDPSVDSQVYTSGVINSEYSSLFLSNTFSLSEGRHITADDKNCIILNKDYAERNGLKLGDTVKNVSLFYDNEPVIEFKIIGLFDIVADKTDEKNMYNEASYYGYDQYAFCDMEAMKEMLKNWDDGPAAVGYESADFFVKDPQQLETVINNVQKISSINWNNFKIIANDEVYERVESSVSDTSSLLSVLVIIVVCVSIAIILLILSMWLKSRKKEIGILMSIGISKPVILLQYIIETLLIAGISFPLSYLISSNFAGSLGALFGKTADITVTPQHFIMVAVCGIALLILSTVIACIPVLRYKPKEILSQME